MSTRILHRLAALAVLAGGPLALAAWSTPAQATSYAGFTLEQQTDASTAIVRGTVKEVWTEFDAYDRVWSRARIAITTTYKGNDLPAEIVVDELGGTCEGITVEVPGRAWFSAEEDVLLFLYHHPSGRWVPVQAHLGKLDIRRAPGEDRLYTRTWQQSDRSGLVYDGRFLPHPPPEQRDYLDDVLARVTARVAAGWDGKPIAGMDLETLRTINLPETRIPR
jgi:hypothetical protein